MATRRESATSERPRADGWTIVSLALVGIALASEYLLPVSNKRAGAPLMANAQSVRQRTNGKRRSRARADHGRRDPTAWLEGHSAAHLRERLETSSAGARGGHDLSTASSPSFLPSLLWSRCMVSSRTRPRSQSTSINSAVFCPAEPSTSPESSSPAWLQRAHRRSVSPSSSDWPPRFGARTRR